MKWTNVPSIVSGAATSCTGHSPARALLGGDDDSTIESSVSTDSRENPGSLTSASAHGTTSLLPSRRYSGSSEDNNSDSYEDSCSDSCEDSFSDSTEGSFSDFTEGSYSDFTQDSYSDSTEDSYSDSSESICVDSKLGKPVLLPPRKGQIYERRAKKSGVSALKPRTKVVGASSKRMQQKVDARDDITNRSTRSTRLRAKDSIVTKKLCCPSCGAQNVTCVIKCRYPTCEKSVCFAAPTEKMRAGSGNNTGGSRRLQRLKTSSGCVRHCEGRFVGSECMGAYCAEHCQQSPFLTADGRRQLICTICNDFRPKPKKTETKEENKLPVVGSS